MKRRSSWLTILLPCLMLLAGCDQALDLIHSVSDPSEPEVTAPGLLVVTLTVRDADKFNNEYFPRAAETLQAADAVSLLKVVNPEALHGEHDGQVLVAFRFPTQEAIRDWYDSPEYQALIPVRTEAADMTFTSYELTDENSGLVGDGVLAVGIHVQDSDRFSTYFSQAGPTVQAAGGALQYRGANAQVLYGENPYPVVALFRFRDSADIMAWYNSPEYQALIPLRLQAADMVFTAYSSPPSDNTSSPVRIQFDKSPKAGTDNIWGGTTWGDLTGEIETVLTRAETVGTIMDVDLTFIVTDTDGEGVDQSFTAEMTGAIDTDTGHILLDGIVTEGWSLGMEAQVDAQVQDNDFAAFRVQGSIELPQ